MYARTTLFELDTVRMTLDDALAHFNATVLPALRQQPGYAGISVLATPEGRGMLVSLWETEAAAAAAVESGFYDEQVAKFLTLLRQPPGRDHYRVLFHEMPVPA
jgi:heme-degrading monooxygenase HmoA